MKRTAALLLGLTVFVHATPGSADSISLTPGAGKFATVADGAVKVDGVAGGLIRADAALKLDKPVKITMKLRRLAMDEKPGHFGIELCGGDNYRGHFYTHDGTNFIAALHQQDKKLNDQSSRGNKQLFPPGPDAPWVTVELYVQPKLTELHVAGTPQVLVNANLLPLKSLSVYGYHNAVEIRDVESAPLAEADPISTDPQPSFQAAFDGDLAATTAAGALAPVKTIKAELVPGVAGQAVRISAQVPAMDKSKESPRLEYPADGLFANHGTLMFWVKTDWDGAFTGDIPTYPMISGLDAAGKEKLNVWMYFWLSLRLGRTGALNSEEMKRDSRANWYRGDWNHVAMVWSDGDWCKAFLNGLPYQQPFGFNGKVFTNLDLKAITRLVMGAGTRNAPEAAFDDLKVYKRPLSNGEVYDEYRKFMPVDLLVDRTVLDAGKADAVLLQAAPGGYFMRPLPADRPLTTGKVQIRVRLTAADDQVVAEKTFVQKLTGPVELKLPVHNLAVGKYRLKCTVGTVQRSFEITAYEPREAMPANQDELVLGEVIFTKDLKDGQIVNAGGANLVASPLGEYLEAGDRKEHKFAFEVPFPDKYLDGRPVLLEIAWPDDKPRSMGLYMYPESKTQHHRDRLGGGIQSGVEYPLTNSMQTVRYLFHPALKRYLFEARTMIGKYPAAIAGFRVYEVKNDRLPRLAINYPGNLPPRRFGYRDEDETFDQNLAWDYKERSVQITTERLLDYLDYTGQNAWQYPFIRYNGYSFPMEGAQHNGLYPYRAEAYRYMVEALGRRGKTTIAGIDLFTLPELKLIPERTDERVRQGWTLTKFNDPPVQPGNQFTKANHANPDVRAMLSNHAAEIARRFAGVSGFDGINITTHSIGFFPSLDYGYDDYTVSRFTKDTGLAVPATSPTERHDFLTSAPQLAKWQAWRNQQSVLLFRQMRSEIDKTDRKLPLYLNVTATPSAEELALFAELQKIKGVYLVPLRPCTGHRHNLHWGKPASDLNDILFDPAIAAAFPSGGHSFSDSFPTYFESFNGSLKNDVFASYFQNADVKPFGRYFLKELAFAVSAADAQRILIGAQPLGTWGRDAEAREFACAYCSLPALPFDAAPGAQDPVAVRYLNKGGVTYLYAVSMLWSECETTLTLSRTVPLTDLSSGEVVSDGRIKLKPFELRSFTAPTTRLKVTGVKTTVPAAVPEFYRARLDRLQQAIARLTSAKIDCGDGAKTLSGMQTALAEGRFAELHRLAFSRAIGEITDKADNFEKFAEQAAMIARGQYAVNCGSTEFYRAKNGTLFFPDRAFGKGDYGYVGAYQNVVRNTDGIQAEDPELFVTEAYSFDGYKFKVTPGTYKVRLYLKAGYKKGFKPDIFVFNVDIQGQRKLDNFDVVTAGDSDFTKVIIKEFSGIEVKNDVLELKFSINPGKTDQSVKLANAIEVIRE